MKVTPYRVPYIVARFREIIATPNGTAHLIDALPEMLRLLPTRTILQIIRIYTDGKLYDLINTEFADLVAAELKARRLRIGRPTQYNAEAWLQFVRHYMPSVPIDRTPSPYGANCLGSGRFPGHDCLCADCPHFFECFPYRTHARDNGNYELG